MNNLNDPIFVVHLACCLLMTGVILVIQLTHYPSFAQIHEPHFKDFHRRHSHALGMIAGPVMTLELATGLWLTRSMDTMMIVNLIRSAAAFLFYL